MHFYRLPKRHLVRRTHEYRYIFKRGSKINYPSLYIYTLAKENGPTRLGLVVSRKVGGAFLRNRYKRIIREFFRLHYTQFPPHTDLVFGVKPNAAHRESRDLINQLGYFLRDYAE